MKLFKLKKLLGSCVTVIGISLLATPASANDWISNWKAFAAETGLAEHAAWVAEIDNDETRALDKKWSDFRGYTADSLISEASIPEQLKPGLIITKDNIDSMPWIKDYLPQFWIDRLTSEWMGVEGIRVVPTNHYYMQEARLEATKALGPNPYSIDEKGNLLDKNGEQGMLTESGLPFTNPENGDQLNWLFNAHGVGSEDLYFDPIVMTGCNNKNKVERSYSGNIWWRRMAGRVGTAPLGNIKGFEGVTEAGSLLIKSPRDVRGLAGVRLRYADADREDNFGLYIPTLRRTRTLTGTNGQDPIAPSLELTWDEWRSHWFKTDKRKFTYTKVEDGFVLAAPEVGLAYDPYRLDDKVCDITGIVDMELRPVWVLDVDDNTDTYQYSKKRTWIDKELYYTQWMEMYDRKGDLWRAWGDSRMWQPKTGRAQWKTVVVPNLKSKRHTMLHMSPAWDKMDGMTNSLFNVDSLRDKR